MCIFGYCAVAEQWKTGRPHPDTPKVFFHMELTLIVGVFYQYCRVLPCNIKHLKVTIIVSCRYIKKKNPIELNWNCSSCNAFSTAALTNVSSELSSQQRNCIWAMSLHSAVVRCWFWWSARCCCFWWLRQRRHNRESCYAVKL